MMDRKIIAGVIAGAVMGVSAVLVVPATAPVTAQETYSEEHLQHTREVMRALKVFNSFDQIIPGMAEQARALFVRNNPALAAEIEEATTNAALSLVPRRAELDRDVINLWAARFTEEEIEAISVFFNSEAGQKFAAQSGALLQDSAVTAKQWGDRLSVEIIDIVREDLEDKLRPEPQ